MSTTGKDEDHWHLRALEAEAEVERLRAELAQEKDVGLSIAESLGQAEARLREVVDDLKHEADMLETFGFSRSPQVRSFLRTTVKRLRALAAGQAKELTSPKLPDTQSVRNAMQDDPWCDDCKGYTHNPDCPAAAQPEEHATVTAVTADPIPHATNCRCFTCAAQPEEEP